MLITLSESDSQEAANCFYIALRFFFFLYFFFKVLFASLSVYINSEQKYSNCKKTSFSLEF